MRTEWTRHGTKPAIAHDRHRAGWTPYTLVGAALLLAWLSAGVLAAMAG